MTGLRGFLSALALYGNYVKDCTPSNATSKVLGTGIHRETDINSDTLFLWVNFDLSKDVFGGTITYSYSYNYVPFVPRVVNLCDEIECPIYADIYNVTGNNTIPNISGHLEGQIDWVDDNNQSIWCIKTTYDL